MLTDRYITEYQAAQNRITLAVADAYNHDDDLAATGDTYRTEQKVTP